jgi:hypothetical protein
MPVGVALLACAPDPTPNLTLYPPQDEGSVMHRKRGMTALAPEMASMVV